MSIPTPKYYWKFDENGGNTATDSVSGAKITIDRPNFRLGKWGPGLRFNPIDGARIATTDIPDQPPPWTAAMWVLREEDSECAALLSSKAYGLKLEQWSNKHTLGITRFSTKWPLDGYDHTFPAATLRGQWTHLAFSATATEAKLYVNGALVESTKAMYALGMKWVGSSFGSVEFAAMILDELKIFHQVLTDDEVFELYRMDPNPKLEVRVSDVVRTSTGSLDLGTVANGQSRDVELTIKNVGQGTLTYTIDATTTGTGFTTPTAKDQPLAVGATSSTYLLKFQSSQAGRAEAVITIKSDDPNARTFTYTIVAMGQDAALPPPPPPAVNPPKVPSPPTPPGNLYVLQTMFGKAGHPVASLPYRRLPPSSSFLDPTHRTVWNGDVCHSMNVSGESAAEFLVMLPLNPTQTVTRRVKRFYITPGDGYLDCYAIPVSQRLSPGKYGLPLIDATSADSKEWTLSSEWRMPTQPHWASFYIIVKWRRLGGGVLHVLQLETDEPATPTYSLILLAP